jgi:tetratricopeptide (TPR) repeat protein
LGLLLDEARAGRSGAIVICGEVGIGKTSLLDAASERASGMRVIGISGSDDMADRPYTGLEQLCRPLLSGIDSLPAKLRQSLQAALGLAAAENSDRLYAYAGALWLLAAAAEKEPLLVCVDNAHLLDEASLHAVAFIAGRLEAEGIALLIATAGDPASFKGAQVIELQPLDRAGSLIHIKRIFGDELSPTVVTEVVHAARGNPLALREIPLSLTQDQRAARVPLENALHNRGSAERAILFRIGALEEKVRRGLLVLALGHGEDRASIAQALNTVGVSFEELEPAVKAALLEDTEGGLSFVHRLVRSVIVYGALRSERRAVHAALAKATKSDSSIWHAARAAAGPDETIAAALEAVADRMVARMANVVAARALELASRLSPDRASRARRLVAAAEAAARAGHLYAAIDHVEEALPELDDESSRAEASLLLGRLFARSGSAARARDLLIKSAARCEATDRPKAGRLLAAAVMPALRAGSPARACEIGQEALALAKGGPTEAAAMIVLGTALTFNGDPDAGRALLLRAAEFDDQLRTDHQMRAYLGAGFRLVGELDRAQDTLEKVIGNARSRGDFGLLPYALVRLADIGLDRGQWPAARAHLAEAISLAREMGRAADLGLALGSLASLDGAQGRVADSRRRAGEAIMLATRLGAGSSIDRAIPGLGLLALAYGDFDTAIEHYAEMRKIQRQQGWCDAAVFPHRTRGLVEALVGAAKVPEAKYEISVFEEEVRQTKRPSAQAALACCQGLVAGPDSIDKFFNESLAYGVELIGPFEHARTLLDYGRRLREIGRAGDAVQQLNGAFTHFAELGAEPWLAQALGELKACGAVPPKVTPDPLAGLGERELQLKLAFARGETPEKAAEHLLLTVPTVKHLWRSLMQSR